MMSGARAMWSLFECDAAGYENWYNSARGR